MPYTKTNDMHIVYKIYINDIRGTIQKYINILHNIYFIAKHFMGCFRDNTKERKFCLGFFGSKPLSLFCVCIYDSIMGIEQSSNRVRRMKVRLIAAVSTYYTITFDYFVMKIFVQLIQQFRNEVFILFLLYFLLVVKTHRRHLCTPQ